MKRFKKYLLFFSIGAFGYGIIEILWRGHTHWSMLTLGGICFSFFGKLASALKSTCLLYKAVIATFFITLFEFIFGLIFNIILGKNIWDYSKVPFNFKGQICLLYSVYWWLLSLIFIPFADFINKRLQNAKKVL